MSDKPSPSEALRNIITAYTGTQLVYVAAKLGIADLLEEGPRSSDELARSVGVNARALGRILRGLVNRGVLVEVEPHHFALTPVGEYLKSGIPGNMRGAAINSAELLYGTWGALLHTVKTGEPAFEHLHGMGWFEYLEKHPENGEIFHKGMATATAAVATAVRKAYDFSEVRRLADIGGGQGILLGEILKANPHLQGVLFEAESVIPGAGRRLQEAGVLDRCEVLGGNFFEAVPPGCDAYILKSIIHDWDDERSIRLLGNCRKGIAPGGRLLLVEPLLPERVQEFSYAVETDMAMMLLLNGAERTVEEYRTLFAAAGFELTGVVPTSTPFSVLEGRPLGNWQQP